MFAIASSLEYLVTMAFGSDDLTPYSAQYTWNSNQMAHAMMGFCLAVCWLTFVISWHPGRFRKAERTAAPLSLLGRVRRWFRELPMDAYVVALFATIPAKEVVDIVLDRGLFARSPVQPNQSSLLFDSVTDTSFWWSGMFLAAAVLALFTKEERGLRVAIPVTGLASCVLFWVYVAGGVWQNQKQTFDVSGMPFNYTRLAVLPGRNEVHFAETSPTKWPELEAFRAQVVAAPRSARPPQAHYVIFGGTPVQRSKLAVAMGCEFAFKLRDNRRYVDNAQALRVMYLTAVGALERPETLLDVDADRLECVIIDDLDVSTKLPSNVSDENLFRFYRDAAEAPTPRPTVPDATGTTGRSPNLPRSKPTVTIPKLDFDKLNRSRMIPIPEARTKQAEVEVPKADIEKLAPPRTPRTVAPDAVQEAKEELEARVAALNSLGAKAKLPDGAKPEDGGISTVWVLAGHPGTSESTRTAWGVRRKFWIREIAMILGVKETELKIIELVDRPSGAAQP